MIHKSLDLTLRRMDAKDGITVAVEMDYDDILMQKIDEQTLRRIFHGLCGD